MYLTESLNPLITKLKWRLQFSLLTEFFNYHKTIPQCMQFCLRVLKALVSSSVAFDNQAVFLLFSNLTLQPLSLSLQAAPLPLQGGKLLKSQSQVQLVDMGPFFQDQYVKSHSSDVFEAYTTLLADIVLALPCQVSYFVVHDDALWYCFMIVEEVQ